MKSWKHRRDEALLLLKKISDLYGGDDEDWLRDYAKEVAREQHFNIDDLTALLKEVHANGKIYMRYRHGVIE